MPYLVNTDKRNTLLDYIGKGIVRACKKKSNQNFNFFSVTCYLDINALEKLASYVKTQVENHQSNLSGFFIFVDIGDWIKTRRTIESVNKDIRKILSMEVVKIYPINFPGQLFHAKTYCLISKRTKNNERTGFVVSSSGNLTMRGLGLKGSGNNIEIASRTTDINALQSFLELSRELKNTNLVSPAEVERQDDFLLALRIFSKGSFYHKWEGNISTEVRFKLNLTELGTAEIEQGTQEFGQYSFASKSISRDPLNMEKMFESIQRPFPKQFWRIYSIDTLLGRWAPNDIDLLIDRVLSDSSQPYIDEITRLTSKNKISVIKKHLLRESKNLKNKGYISDDPQKAVDLWEERIKVFRKNRKLITARIFNYEKIPDILDSSNRSSILKMLKILKEQFSMKSKIKGLKSILRDEISHPNRRQFHNKINKLTEDAKLKLNQHGTING